MPTYVADIPRKEKRFRVTLIFTEAYATPHADESSLVYLNRVRLFPERVRGSLLERQYVNDVAAHRQTLGDLLSSFNVSTIVAVPSSQSFVLEYLDEARARFPAARNLSSYFAKKAGTSGGRAESLISFLPAITFTPPTGLEIERGAILIIDDVISDGISAAAVIERLEEVKLVGGRQIIVAAPLAVIRNGGIPPVPAC